MSYELGAWQAERQNHANAMTALNQANANIRTLNRLVEGKNARIAELEDALAVALADAAGAFAQYAAFKAEHAASPLFADSGRRFKDGRVKSRIRLIFERAFDASLAAAGIANPAARRND
ncbi:hypothetical protein [Roseomonas xinghualingensis]|uniref:hypothetical protein n=1 Tax=Roseomonas xinghualingensis TaxID=2986475 RepID=UPI0021F122E4|nr:hypothetical protein [Roseomonas sp. SXEYE001]MCV4209538.1 hypothetical protein [Roseomonas sp. SXEYE001]